MKPIPFLLLFNFLLLANFSFSQSTPKKAIQAKNIELKIIENQLNSSISIFRKDGKSPILTQIVKPDFRPYLHPIVAPDGKGILTEYSPGHHLHQTGIYWGYTRVNGRDYFHNPKGDYWRKVASKVIKSNGPIVKWETVYDLLDEKGNVTLTETQTYTMQEVAGKYLIDLVWTGEAKTEVTIGKYDYGGLFVRMPWKQGIEGQVINGARQKNEKAEGQRSNWVDIGMKVEGRTNQAHIAIFDHPDNKGFPQNWRVDGQLGVGVARAKNGDWQIKKGNIEVIKHQLVVYSGDHNDLALNQLWSDFSGQEMAYSLWGIAQKEGRDAQFLSPDEAVKNMTMMDGLTTNAWAAEPMITQPMAFCWDDRGRLWIAENRDYESRGHGFSKAGNSRILILEDTNHDGTADTKKVFLEGIAFPAAIAVGFDGLYLGAPPNLLFVPDKNHDDLADIENIEVKLTGWGIRDRHETLNSLHWGPDGWLYGCQGFATPSKVRKPIGKGKIYKHNDPFPEDILEGEGTDINGGVWRYHPIKDQFEVVAHGFSNPWGIDYDAKGQLFISACVIPHMWHVIPGGVYHRQGGQHFNPYLYSDIRTIADHSHRSAHGGARVYQSDAFPAEHKGRIFMANIHEHAVLSDILEKSGSGFIAKHGDELMQANNAQWVGFSMEVGPDGGIYVLDWHDADICGKEVINGETGRVFRTIPKNSLAKNWADRYKDLNELTDIQLVDLQKSESDWHARRARLILQNRSTKNKLNENAVAELQSMLQNNENADFRLRALWTLFISNNLIENQLLGLLVDKDQYIRAWAIQMLCEDKNPSKNSVELFVKMAKSDPSAVVRLYLSSSLQRMDANAAWAIANELVKHAEDIADHNLPKMLWFGIEPLVKANWNKAIDLANVSKIPLITNYLARRLADADQHQLLISNLNKNKVNQKDLLEGLRDALEGRFDLKTPINWNDFFVKIRNEKSKNFALAKQINQQFGDTEVSQDQLITLRNKNSILVDKKAALKALSSQKQIELLKEIPSLLEDQKLRPDVIIAIANYNDEALAKLLISKYNSFNVDEKKKAIETLSARPKYGWQLSQALKNKLIPKSDIPAYSARQLLRVVGSGFIEVWGPIEQEQSLEKAYTKYHQILTEKAVNEANSLKGSTVFQKACGSCHKMYGKGGDIGPELTGSHRANTDYLLFNILNPSGEIQDDYKLVVITTRDGRTYSGNVVSENERQIVMKIVGQETTKINKADIQSKETMPTSLMPVGIFDTLNETEVLDLVKYMKGLK